MGYSFRADEAIVDGVRRIAEQQLAEALNVLAADGEAAHGGVHEARQHLKKTRALWRLVRKRLDSAARKENDRLRQIGEMLSSVRDAEALVEAFDALRQRFACELPVEAYDAIRAALVERRNRIADGQLGSQPPAGEAADKLRAASRRAARWTMKSRGFSALAPGFRETYRLGRKAMKKACALPTDENFHQWRKRVKDHWYHVRLLKNTWPAVLEARQSALKELSDLLGDDHDLVVMRGVVRGEPERFSGCEAADSLVELIDRRAQELRKRAEHLGRRLYAASPKSQVKQMRACWEAWVAEELSAPRG
jgi:CHAD domain-containing protein